MFYWECLLTIQISYGLQRNWGSLLLKCKLLLRKSWMDLFPKMISFIGSIVVMIPSYWMSSNSLSQSIIYQLIIHIPQPFTLSFTTTPTAWPVVRKTTRASECRFMPMGCLCSSTPASRRTSRTTLTLPTAPSIASSNTTTMSSFRGTLMLNA